MNRCLKVQCPVNFEDFDLNTLNKTTLIEGSHIKVVDLFIYCIC